MFYLSEEKFLLRMKEIERNNLSKKRKRKLREEKCKHKDNFKLPSTSKMILMGAVLLCLQIVAFCEYIMIKTGDTSALYVLIGIPATLVPVIWGYYSKAKAENTSGGIVFETTMAQVNKQDASIDDSEGVYDTQG